MVGPRGGPSRKSHTKSRNGCRTCKRRHIRCDESFPQCRNCTKHNCRCDYMDASPVQDPPSSSPSNTPDLLMSPEIESEIDNWHITGVPPFPELLQCPRTGWYGLSRTDLRLIHHIIGLSIDLHRRGYSNCTVWAQKMPNFLAIALSNDFVMNSILALSAAHLSWMTRNQDTKQLAYHHRGTAIKGLHKAIGSFSSDNCEAILAASTLLSWQTTEWQSWASLQKGITTVLNAMHPILKQSSELAQFLENQRYLGCTNSPVMTGYRFQEEDLVHVDRTIMALENVQKQVARNNHEHFCRMGELLDFLRHFRENLPNQTPEQAFECVQPLRRWLFWLPPAMLRGGEADIGALVILAHFFAAGVALDSIFPDLGGAYLGPLSIMPVEEISRIIVGSSSTDPFNPELQQALNLMDLPQQIVTGYKNRLYLSPRSSFDYPSPTPPSPYHPPVQNPNSNNNNNNNNNQLHRVSSSPSTTSSYTPYTPPLQSPPEITVPNSPFDLVDYVTAPTAATTQGYYPPTPASELPAYPDDLCGVSSGGHVNASSHGHGHSHDDALGIMMGNYDQSGRMAMSELCWT